MLTTANLNATDPDSPRPSLVYTATQVAGGRFELAGNPGVAITTFTQTQVDAGQVLFVQTGGTAPPTYTLRVSDGTLVSPPSTVTIQAFNPLQGTQLVGNTLYVNGTGGSDSIQVKLKDGKIVVSPKGGVPFAFKVSDVQHIVISLGDGNDKVKIDSDIRVDVLINGGNGNDTITAGGGNAILVGGAGNDTLKGGSRGDILIGGTGSDKLTGSDGGDLLIAGSTVYDNDPAALRALLSECIASVSYATRVNQLLTGTGPTGIRLQSGVTVFADNDPDKLTGNDGADWFLADRPNDKVKGLSGDEIFTNIDPLLDQV